MCAHREVDVVIVGAGAAGLGAARRAGEKGLTFIVCEAMDRIGGRAFTDTETFGTPWDRGCHWLHSASVNVFRELADTYGFTYVKESPKRRAHDGTRWLTDDEHKTAETATYEGLWGAIAKAGEAGRDLAASDVVDMSHPWIPMLRTSLAGEWSVDIPDVSTLDDVAYRDTNENWPVADGYGALVARHAQGIPVELGNPVRTVKWDGPRIEVETANGTISARAVVITVSTRVMQEDVIKFSPPLPAWKREAYDAIQLGNANKISFKIDRNLLAEEDSSAWVKVHPDQGMWFQLRAFDRDMANGYLAGALGQEIEAQGERAMLDIGRQALVMMYGSDILKAIQVEACSMWQSDPWVRGAYGAARPGKAHLRRDLATPIDGRLYFAGEATSLDFFSTCHGAYLTGLAAIDALVNPRD